MKTAYTVHDAEAWFNELDHEQRHVATILSLGYTKQEYDIKEKVMVYKYVLAHHSNFY